MKVDTLEQLGEAFGEWRRRKKHPREKVPEVLLKRARRTAPSPSSPSSATSRIDHPLVPGPLVLDQDDVPLDAVVADE